MHRRVRLYKRRDRYVRVCVGDCQHNSETTTSSRDQLDTGDGLDVNRRRARVTALSTPVHLQHTHSSHSPHAIKATEDSRLQPLPLRNALFASTVKLRCVRQGLRPRDVSQRGATQRGAEMKRLTFAPLYGASNAGRSLCVQISWDGATPCQHIDTTRKAIDCATTLMLRFFI